MSSVLEFLRRFKTCPECGHFNVLAGSHCAGCGARIRNRNPVLRFVVTIAAVGVTLLVIWWKLKK